MNERPTHLTGGDAMRSITPLDVRFAASDAPHRAVACVACGTTADAAPVLDVPVLVPPHAELTLARCARCASLVYDPPGIRDFSDLGANRALFARFYAEVAGGVWETIWPLLAAGRTGSLLDVGCGFGFAVDFWQRSRRGDAVGVELADYGAAGASALGVTIHGEMLEDCEALRGRRFDVVYASEVFEHVEAPAAFARLLARRVADDGVLVLTTPAAEFIAPEHRGPTLLAALAPGFHGFLLSAGALEQLLRDAGFEHVEVRRFHERQVAWASRQRLQIELDDPRMRAACFDYMAARLDTLDAASPAALGYAYRLLRDYTNTGRLVEAHELLRRLRGAVERVYGTTAIDADAVVDRYAKARSLDDVGAIGPFFLPGYFHFAGALAQHVERDYPRALACYRAAAETSRSAARVGIVLFGEAASIHWPARIAHAVLTLALGDDGGAVTLAELAAHGRTLDAEHAFTTVDARRIEELLPGVAEELTARGRWQAAAVVARAYAGHVEREYGVDPAGVEAMQHLVARDAQQRPADPIFVAWFAALDRFQSPATREAGRDALIAFADAAERVVGPHASRARTLAAKARRAVQPPAFSFEMSFNLSPPR
jgi:SAM-dependent methyltransferase